jgi:hypothetical protein
MRRRYFIGLVEGALHRRASRVSQSALQYQNGFQVGPSVNFR